jgi:hypothetical protein
MSSTKEYNLARAAWKRYEQDPEEAYETFTHAEIWAARYEERKEG